MNRRTRWVLVAVLVAVGLPPIAFSDAGTVQAAAASVGCEPLPAGGAATAPSLESYTAINPQRLVDTRNNIGGWGTTIGAGCTMRVNLAADVPANAAAVSLSMTAISPTRDYFTVYPVRERPTGDLEPQHPARHPDAQPRRRHPGRQPRDLHLQPRHGPPDHRSRGMVVGRTRPFRVDPADAGLRHPSARRDAAGPLRHAAR